MNKFPHTPGGLAGRVLYRDANLLILDKPAGLAVHAGPRTAEHLEGMLAALAFERRQPPRLVHRLDRDTSGCLLLARHDKAVSRLGRLFEAGRIGKTYWAVVAGQPPADQGCVDLPLAKVSSAAAGWRMLADPGGRKGGRPARTEWRVLGRSPTAEEGAEGGLAWIACRPLTGRTHQIRVHLASGLGCPILGDPLYGPARDGIPPMHLHARTVSVPYWADRPPVLAEAPPPPHMRAALRRCGWREEEDGREAGAPATSRD